MDSLTNLLTRSEFHKQAADIINSGKKGAAFVWLNLDNFKMFNSRFGFNHGDKLLQEIANALAVIFPNDLIARFNDDNFVILTDWTTAETNIENIQGYIYAIHQNITLRLRAGIYLPLTGAKNEDVRISCDRAKLACDSIRKNHSVSSCMFHEGMSKELALQQYILDNLDYAINNGYIKTLYQPIVNLSSGRICEVEALARWNSPEHGFIAPSDFIPTLEQYREIQKIDIHSLKQVCRDYQIRHDSGLKVLPVSINLSRLDFELCDIYIETEKILASCNVPPEMIRIEITESANEDDTALLNLGIEKFRASGHEIWMDDFGTGYSSLNVLKDYNFDTVKFDMEFLNGFDINKSDKAKYIISSSLSMARLMGMKALAEGVETSEQLEYLTSIGFDMAQGYYFGKPMTLDEIFTLERSAQ